MSNYSQSDHHIVHVWVSPDGERQFDIFHPGHCGLTTGTCDAMWEVEAVGLEDTFAGYEPGFHRFVVWHDSWWSTDFGTEYDGGVRDVEPEELPEHTDRFPVQLQTDYDDLIPYISYQPTDSRGGEDEFF